MSNTRPSIKSVMVPDPTYPSQQRRNVKTVHVQKQDTSGRLPHTSFYCTPAVLKALKEIAVARDMKVHDLLTEGVRAVMEKNGKDFDQLSKRR
jgi:cytosine/adenosine deaminase-related metal-dependent hydrolase